MGDNLGNARKYILDAQSRMAKLLSGTENSRSDVLASLSYIRAGAQSIQARAIARMAHLTLQDYNPAHRTHQTGANLLALNKLIHQYDEGLRELETELTPREPANDLTESYEAAKSTLSELIPLSKDDREERILSKLTSLDLGLKTEIAEIDFHEIVPSLTNEFLRMARTHAKSVSLSFSADPVRLPRDRLSELQDGLLAIGKVLISEAVAFPAQREATGLGKTAHIAVTLVPDRRAVNVLITCDGEPPVTELTDLPVIDRLVRSGAKLGLEITDRGLSIALADFDIASKPEPTIGVVPMEQTG